MDHECRLAFLNWVAYHLSSKTGKPRGHLYCPLTGCQRNDFEDYVSYLHHVAECPYLPGATYRCPYCNRDECFAVGALRYEQWTQDQKHGKNSKVRDAVVSFFKHFGRKKAPCHRQELPADAPLPIYRPELQAAGLIDDKPAIAWPYDPPTFGSPLPPEIYTMNRDSYGPILGELPTPCPRPELLGAVSFAPRMEMSGTRSYIHQQDRTDDDNHNSPTEYASASSQLEEKGPESPRSGLTSPEPLPNYGAKSHSYHQHYTSNYSITDLEYCDSEQRWGKISGTTHVLSPKSTSLPSGLESGMLGEQSNYGGTTPRSRQDLRLDIPRMIPGITEALPLNAETSRNTSAVIAGPQEVCQSLPHGGDKQDSVDELFQIASGLEYTWARKLKNSPELSSITSHLHSAPALQGGLGVLRQLFESNVDVPGNTEHLFRLMHITFACAYKSYSTDKWYPWDSFYEDVLRWSQIIAEPADQDLYLQVADLLWSAPQNMVHSMHTYEVQDRALSLDSVNFEKWFASHNSVIEGTLSTSQLPPIPSGEACERLVVLEQLKKGDVLKSCARFLDGN
ncbi:MAG: hypothetical protein Q9195_005835 [Heterodermia aff. obscurata]